MKQETANVLPTIDDLQVATRLLVGEGILDGFGDVSAWPPALPDRSFMLRSNLAESCRAGKIERPLVAISPANRFFGSG